MKISEACTFYANNYLRMHGNPERDIKSYDFLARSLVKSLGDLKLTNLNLEKINKWERDRFEVCCQNTVSGNIVMLRNVLRFVSRCGYKCISYEIVPVPRRIPVTPAFLTAEEVSRMIKVTPNTRNRFILSLLYSTGLRVAELVNLDREQVKRDGFTVVGKGKKERSCLLMSARWN